MAGRNPYRATWTGRDEKNGLAYAMICYDINYGIHTDACTNPYEAGHTKGVIGHIGHVGE